jgi:hypothetical protein
VTDSADAPDEDELRVAITPNTIAPTIMLKPSISLSSPDHMPVTKTVADMVERAEDDCDGNLTGSVVIEKVTSDEPDDASGGGDGNTTNDIAITANCKSAALRNERQGAGNGRVYSVTLRVTDSSSNTARAVFQVNVPKGDEPVKDDGPVPETTKNCP